MSAVVVLAQLPRDKTSLESIFLTVTGFQDTRNSILYSLEGESRWRSVYRIAGLRRRAKLFDR